MKKHIPLLILTLFLISVSSGAVIQDSVKHTLISSSDTPYEGIITEGTKEKGSGIFVVTIDDTLRRGNRYEGEFLGTKFHGEGTMNYSDGVSYVGEWKDGKYHGQGTLTFPNGYKYSGEIRNTSGWNTVVVAGKIIEKIGPILAINNLQAASKF